MTRPTVPAIKDQQNTDRSLRLLAAQRRLYSDAKAIHNARFAIILAAGTTGAALALTLPSLRPQIGFSVGLLLFVISVMGGSREKRKIKEASSIQEEFDVEIFQIPRNPVLADRPSCIDHERC